MKLDVVMVCSQFPPIYGGAGGQAALLAKYLSRRGWKIAVATLDQAGIGTEKKGQYSIHRVFKHAPRTMLLRFLSTLSLTLLASWLVLTTRPRVTHIHGIYWWSILPAAFARAIGGRVILKSTRDGEDDPWTVRNRTVGSVRIGWLYGISMRFADVIVTLNRQAFESAVRAGYRKKTIILKNGVDRPHLERTAERRLHARETHGFAEKDKVVLFVGYLAEHKGVLDLIDAFSPFEGVSDVHLLLAGPAEGFYRELGDRVPLELARLRSRGVSNVTTLGQVDNSEMPEFYWAADVFVLPSYAEGMPNSLAEAVVAGCRIVATRIPGITDTVEEDEAWLVTPGDVAALRAALTEAIDDQERDAAGAAKRVDMDMITSQYEAIYRDHSLVNQDNLS